MDNKKIGGFLRDLRKEHNLTQEELGEKLGATNKTISRWETGTYLPPADILLQMSKLYGVSVNEILSGERLDTRDYQPKAEENIVTTLTNTSAAKRQNKRTAIICCAIILALAVIAGVILGVYLGSPRYIIVTFDSSGGSATEQFVINAKDSPISDGGYLIAEPKCPVKENSSLEGWYRDPEYINRWDFDTDIINSSITLYAKWEDATDGLQYVETDKVTIDGNIITEKIPGYEVSKYDSYASDVIIPSHWQGKPVWTIGFSAFANSDIESVVIPDTVFRIDGSAFGNCVNLKEVTFGKDVQYIGDAAFSNCISLQRVDFPQKLAKIGNHAFEYCTSLLEVETEYYLLEIGSRAFARCYSLTHFTIGSGVLYIAQDAFQESNSLVEVRNRSYKIDVSERQDLSNVINFYGNGGEQSKLFYVDYKYVVYDLYGEKPLLVKYYGSDKNVILPETFNGKSYDIQDYAFYHSDVVSVTVPDCVQSIGKNAFCRCEQLETVKLGNHVESISESAFSMCGKLSRIDIPDTLSYLGAKAFSGCYDLKSINLGRVKAIESQTFGWCYDLRSVRIPNGATYIASEAFYATGLNDIYIPKTVTDIAKDAFACDDLRDIVVEEGNRKYHAVDGNLIETATKTLLIGSIKGKIPNDGSVTRIAKNAYSHRYVFVVNIPSCIDFIEDGAFDGNWAIHTITVDKDNPNYLVVNNCLISKEGKLIFMPRETTIPNDGCVTSIGDYAMSLVAENPIVIPASVTYIGGNAFALNKAGGITLRYMGTKEQFLQIVIGGDADWPNEVVKVMCDDGEILPPQDDANNG